MINRPRGEKQKKNPKQQEQNKKPLIGKTTVLCLEDDWGRAAEEKKSNNTRAVNDFYCRVASSFQSAAYEKNSPQHQFCSAGRRVDMVSGRCRKMSQVLVVEKTEVGKKKPQLNFSLSNSEVAPQHTVVPQTGSRPLPRPLVLFEELCTRSLCKLSTQHFPRRRRGLCNLQKKKKKSG